MAAVHCGAWQQPLSKSRCFSTDLKRVTGPKAHGVMRVGRFAENFAGSGIAAVFAIALRESVRCGPPTRFTSAPCPHNLCYHPRGRLWSMTPDQKVTLAAAAINFGAAAINAVSEFLHSGKSQEKTPVF
jgi:hypothetical protein